MPILNLPGLGGSGAAHWQSLWEQSDPRIVRFAPSSWDNPELDDWRAALDRALEPLDGPVVLVAHSLSCLLVAHWAPDSALAGRVAGAFLVGPPDRDGPNFPQAEATGFGVLPGTSLPFPGLVIASSDDPYGSISFAQKFAKARGAGFVDIGPKGHINAQSGLGDWAEGQRLLTAFCAGLSFKVEPARPTLIA